MKSKFLTLALALSVGAFAQKKELREVEKTLEKGNLQLAETLLEQAKEISLADPKFAQKFYYLQGLLFLEKAKKNENIVESLQKTSASFSEAEKLGKDFKTEISKLKVEASNFAQKEAIGAYEAKDYAKASPIFEQIYRFSSNDTIFLYNAAVVASQANNYQLAVKYYEELKNIKYSGAGTIFSAKNKETGKFENFGSKAERDLMVKSGSHTEPKDEKEPSKRSGIVKDLAFLYVELGRNNEALKSFADARKENPKDANLLLNEASLHFKLGDKERFKTLNQEAALLEPNNPDIQYNIGVINLQQNNYDEARKFFEKALSIRPTYPDSVLNISFCYINEGNTLVEEMNKLGNSKAEVEKYNALKKKRDELFKKSANVLENYIKTQPSTPDILEQLKNIYGALGDTANFKKIKDLLEK